MILIPFDSMIPFTIGSLITWYLAGAVCVGIGTLGAVFFCGRLTWIKMVIGGLLGMGCYYCFSWAFQSRVSMEFGQVLKIVIN